MPLEIAGRVFESRLIVGTGKYPSHPVMQAAHLAAGAYFVDLNSVSPATKVAAARIVADAGARYVEAAVMAPIGPKRIATSMLLGGPHAEEFLGFAREIGAALEGNTTAGWRWDVGITTGHDLSAWDAASEEGLESPLGSIHQEGQLARAGDLSSFGAVNYTGIPGLRVGGSVVYGDISQGQPGFDNNKLLLWEGHARWTPGSWDLSALYARGTISDTAAVNLTLVGNPVLIPESFYGWYAQAAYIATLPNSWTLAPFARFERVNTGAGYAFIGAGLTPAALEAEEITTLGINLNINSGVVFKLDYQKFDLNSDADRIDLGLGYAF